MKIVDDSLPTRILIVNSQQFETQVFLSLIEEMNISCEYVDIANTPQEAIELFNQSLASGGFGQSNQS